MQCEVLEFTRIMKVTGRELCRDVLVACFSQILPWNDPDVLNAVMTMDSNKLHVYDDVPQYEKRKVQQQLGAIRTLRMLKRVNRLFSEMSCWISERCSGVGSPRTTSQLKVCMRE